MNMKHLAMMLAVPAAIAAAPAEAATFTYAITGAYNASFSIDSNAAKSPAAIGADYFLVENIAGTFDGVAQVANSIQFSTAASNGGFTIELPNGNFLGFFGAQLFTGTTATPTLRTGQFALTSDIDGSTSLVTISAVPESATWTLMIAGLGATGVALRRRKSMPKDALAA